MHFFDGNNDQVLFVNVDINKHNGGLRTDLENYRKKLLAPGSKFCFVFFGSILESTNSVIDGLRKKSLFVTYLSALSINKFQTKKIAFFSESP